MDNATLHSGADTFITLKHILEAYGVQLVWLPTYSPELNPCEMVFGRLKAYLREHRDFDEPFWLEILNSMVHAADWDQLMRWYMRCRRL